ncbi:hypothetical protein P175DRAFT_0558076 [Aspergillus ochraceoroseus IBT 24754]|uniref:Ig-like domain-containing protein n=1 Tax=Aspergillus ochraceoroseus IBT 24754 TaxID=1392256 RepID=A0A2T5LUA9_9EURO|nr:uncharacterized protein P175DRAFT_0558076 [Aspergillus ochraceoroseus IBT 24754]PTU19872.1 hypothetical protein P175DRAFT_0558076 [Aspergillus ochraceoroseus IBT 24754]
MCFLLTLTLLIPSILGQIQYDTETNSLLCSSPAGHYCISGSLQGSTIISCVSASTAEIRSCNIELSNILPPGYEKTAVCYESSPAAGDAVCAFNGTGHTFTHSSQIPVPETILCASALPGTKAPTAHGLPLHPEPETTQPKEAQQQQQQQQQQGKAHPGDAVAAIGDVPLFHPEIDLAEPGPLPLPPPATRVTVGIVPQGASSTAAFSDADLVGKSVVCSDPWTVRTRLTGNTRSVGSTTTMEPVLVVPPAGESGSWIRQPSQITTTTMRSPSRTAAVESSPSVRTTPGKSPEIGSGGTAPLQSTTSSGGVRSLVTKAGLYCCIICWVGIYVYHYLV